MNGRTLYQVTTPYACAGIEVDYATKTVIRAAPIFSWMYGKALSFCQAWIRSKGVGFTLTEVKE
jgi:hypothetical protein